MSALVLACGDGLSGVTPGEWLSLSNADIRVIGGLCCDPDVITRDAEGAYALVLAFCSADLPRAPVQAAVRRAGLDPLGVEIVDLRVADGDTERLILLLEAAAARAHRFAGSAPENARASFSKAVTRRALVRLRVVEYVAVPSVEPSRCVADRGCRVCIDACPRGAILTTVGTVSVDSTRCDSCGLCTTACPVAAVVDPTVTPAQLEAQVRTLVDPSIGPPGPRGILFTCRRSRRPETASGWYPVVVPCTGMMPASWLLAPLLLGAAAVAVRPCADAGCPAGWDARVHERVAFSRRFLSAIGWSEEHVSAEPGELPRAAVLAPDDALHDVFAPGAAGHVLLALAERGTGGHAFAVEHPGCPVGTVEIRAGACTVCGMCARACPTEALVFAPRDGAVDITFDGVRCTACGQCAASCPEVAGDAIAVRPLATWDVLSRGATRLVGSDVAACLRCGQPVAPLTMLSRVAELLGPEEGHMTRLLKSYCLACRAFGPPVRDERGAAADRTGTGAAMTISGGDEDTRVGHLHRG